jgi:hypothetical protein
LLWDIQRSQDLQETKVSRASEAIDEFKAEIIGQLERGEIPELTRLQDITAELQPLDMITRADHETQISALLTRAETAETSLAGERAARAAAEERAEKAEKQANRPRLNTVAVERAFTTIEKKEEAQFDPMTEIKRLQENPGETDAERDATSIRISQLKHLTRS